MSERTSALDKPRGRCETLEPPPCSWNWNRHIGPCRGRLRRVGNARRRPLQSNDSPAGRPDVAGEPHDFVQQAFPGAIRRARPHRAGVCIGPSRVHHRPAAATEAVVGDVTGLHTAEPRERFVRLAGIRHVFPRVQTREAERGASSRTSCEILEHQSAGVRSLLA